MQPNNHGLPDGYHTVTPYLAATSTDSLIEFLEAAFEARMIERNTREDGTVAHAEVEIGDSKLMMCDATEQHPFAPATFYLYVQDVDETYRLAIDAGARSIAEPENMPYGDRHGGVVDPAGHRWWIATRLLDHAKE